MTNTGDVIDESIEDGDGSEDSQVLNEVRSQNRDLKKELKETKGNLEAAVEEGKAQVRRELEIGQLVSQAGFPKMGDVVANQLEGDVTAEAVAGVLQGLGVQAQDAVEDDGEPEVPATVEDVANLGTQVANAAKGSGGKSFEDELSETDSIEDVVNLMGSG
jgi:hypothetical protein